MLKLRYFKLHSFWLFLLSFIFSWNTLLYSEQPMPENITDTALTWINQARTREGLNELSIDKKLNAIAEKHSKKMIEYNLHSDSSPVSGTPFERIQSSGLSDINNLVATARAKNWTLLKEELKYPENLSKLLSPEMTHAGIGIEQSPSGDLYLTIHMIERAIKFSQFTLSQSNTSPARRSITIKGSTAFKKMEARLVPQEDTAGRDPVSDHIITPDANGDFEIKLSFGTATGVFVFEFYVQKDGVFQLKNSFTMNI